MKTKLYFEHQSATYTAGEEFVVHVFVDTKDQIINAVEGTISLDPVFEVVDTKSADSDVTFWVIPPTHLGNLVSFSGITPGGIRVPQARILSLTLRATSEGSGTIDARDIKVFQHDGKGSLLENTVSSTSIRITKGENAELVASVDQEKPEIFVPLLGNDPSLFGGRHFIAFYTQDTGSGVREYQVKEGLWSRYRPAQSPYELNNQRLDSTIYVKAIDQKGNERVVTVSAQNAPWLYIGMILIVVLLVTFLWKRTFSKR